MKISYSNVQSVFQPIVNAIAVRHIEKLRRLLKHYAPDLVQLHGSLEKHPRKVEYTFSLNLTLPTGTLNATGQGSEVRTSVKGAFAELESQVKKHQQKVRKDYLWKRRRSRGAGETEEATASD